MRTTLFLSLILPGILFADIEQVVVKWSPQLCQGSCIKQLGERFGKMRGVEKVSIDQPNGVMQLKWKEKAPFSYTDLDWNMRWIGLYMTYVRVKATGTIIKKGKIYSLQSKNDNTMFELIGSANAIDPNLAVATNSVYNRPLNPSVMQQLDAAIDKKQLISIDGPLFEPWRGPPIRIVVDQIHIQEPKTKGK